MEVQTFCIISCCSTLEFLARHFWHTAFPHLAGEGFLLAVLSDLSEASRIAHELDEGNSKIGGVSHRSTSGRRKSEGHTAHRS